MPNKDGAPGNPNANNNQGGYPTNQAPPIGFNPGRKF